MLKKVVVMEMDITRGGAGVLVVQAVAHLMGRTTVLGGGTQTQV